MKHFKFIITLLILLLKDVFAQTPNAESLVKYQDVIYEKSGKRFLGIALKIEPSWHTYWKNPGDAGTPTDFNFQLNNKSISLNPLEWPAPNRYFEQGDLLAYGYEKLNIYFFEIDKKFENKIIDAEIKWLVCKDICIPGKGNLKINLSKNVKQNQNLVTPAEIENAFNSIPQTLAWPKDLILKSSVDLENKKIYLDYELSKNEKSKDYTNSNILTPFPVTPFGFKREVLTNSDSSLKAKMLADWDGEYQEPEMPLPKDGVFKNPMDLKFLYFNSTDKKYYVINHELKVMTVLKKKEIISNNASVPETHSILTYLILAFWED